MSSHDTLQNDAVFLTKVDQENNYKQISPDRRKLSNSAERPRQKSISQKIKDKKNVRTITYEEVK